MSARRERVPLTGRSNHSAILKDETQQRSARVAQCSSRSIGNSNKNGAEQQSSARISARQKENSTVRSYFTFFTLWIRKTYEKESRLTIITSKPASYTFDTLIHVLTWYL